MPRRSSVRCVTDLAFLVALALLATVATRPLCAQPSPAVDQAERAAALAVADSALAAISRNDVVGFTDLMLPEAVMFPTSTREGVTRYAVRTREAQRAAPFPGTVSERGWNAEVRVSGAVAMVWYPYDLYLDGKWSHCGVDIFTLVRHQGQWRIATMAWSAIQPPACEKHPKGPPPGAKP